MKPFDESTHFIVRETRRYHDYYVTVNEKGKLGLSTKLKEILLGKMVVVGLRKADKVLCVQEVQEKTEDSMIVKKNGNFVVDFKNMLMNQGCILPIKYIGRRPENGLWEGKAPEAPSTKRAIKKTSKKLSAKQQKELVDLLDS